MIHSNVGVRVVGVVLGGAACVHLHGKGRKDRSVPLWQSTASAVRAWLHANPDLRGSAALLPNRSGHPMTRCNVAQRLPARLLLFPDENHWSPKPRNSRLWREEFFGWLKRHDPRK